jgi:hypothetical protein
MLTGSSQNRQCSRLLQRTHGAHGHSRLPVWEAGANSFVSLKPNIVNPTLRLFLEAGASARNADGVAGRGDWRKLRPFGNRADRGIASLRKQADFQLVVRDERTNRTFAGGNSK